MTGIDWVIVGTIGLSVLVATAQGFFYEVFSLAGAVLGFLFAAWEYPLLAVKFLPFVRSQAIADAASFLTIFFATLILAGIVARIVRMAVQGVGLRWADRLLGAAFGLIRGIVVVTVAITALTAFEPQSNLLAGSYLSRYFLVSGQMAVWAAPSSLRAQFNRGLLILRGLHASEKSRQ